MSLWDKMDTIAKKIYGASGISAPANVKNKLMTFKKMGMEVFLYV